MPYPGTFIVCASGPNGQTIAQIDVRQAVRPLAPGHQAAWFTYDADNRTVVNNGQLADNRILATADAGSYVNVYDAAGNVAQQLTLHGDGQVYGQSFSHDARNEEAAAHCTAGVPLSGGGVRPFRRAAFILNSICITVTYITKNKTWRLTMSSIGRGRGGSVFQRIQFQPAAFRPRAAVCAATPGRRIAAARRVDVCPDRRSAALDLFRRLNASADRVRTVNAPPGAGADSRGP